MVNFSSLRSSRSLRLCVMNYGKSNASKSSNDAKMGDTFLRGYSGQHSFLNIQNNTNVKYR